MSPAIAIAAILATAVAAAHSYLGERYILIRLFRRQDLPHLFGSDAFTKQTLRFAWHLTSVTWIGIAAALWALDRGSVGGAMRAISVTFFVCGAVSLVASRGRHLSWIAFLGIAASAWIGAPP